MMPPPADKQDETCRPCATLTKTKRYCAPARCYCGHDECPAFASFVDLDAIPLADATISGANHASAWADRGEGSSWIDQM